MAQPRIKVRLTIFDKSVEIFGLLFMLLLLGMPAYYYASLPELVPTHFNLVGEPDDFGSKSSIWSLPAIGLVMGLGMTILSRFPHYFNYLNEITEENAQRQYRIASRLIRILNTAILGLFLGIANNSISIAIDGPTFMSDLLLPFYAGVTLAIPGMYWLSIRKL